MVSDASHSRPPNEGCCMIVLERKACPPHLVQFPHSLQSPYSQSTLLPQLWVLQGASSDVSPSQGYQEPSAPARTSRLRDIWPPSQLTEHSDQEDHVLKLQPSGSGVSQVVPGSAGQCSICDRLVALSSEPQGTPPFRGCTLIPLLLSRIPVQGAWQADQSLHSVSSQSTAPLQMSPSLQLSILVATPSAGLPQALASWITLLCAKRKPPRQVFVHSDHPSQSPHSPSWQLDSTLQAPSPQDFTSSKWFCSKLHGLPPTVACCTTWRSRSVIPPVHVLVQSLHSDQGLIVQS
mmetsp:Transcript_98506/g.234529  ORF Transcript_98506/g.234529 Transcript_98506/m.234529 type:complete len:292 (-) Transcript_98506:1315-2190(-)